MTNQPEWVLLANLGDVNPIDYGGLFVYTDKTGVYPPELEQCEPQGSDDDGEPSYWEIRRMILEPCTYVGGVLSDNRFHPDHPAWFADSLCDVAKFVGMTEEEIRSALCGADVVACAKAYLAIADYHGWDNFDDYPRTFTDRVELVARYNLP